MTPFPGPGGKRQISTNGGIGAKWRGDGKEIYYASPAGELMAAEVTTSNGTLQVGRVHSAGAQLSDNEMNGGSTSGTGPTEP